jgi:hypothetical protein
MNISTKQNSEKRIFNIIKVLPTDYATYGGEVVRWQKEDENYPDCSCQCRYFTRLEHSQMVSDPDFGVCMNPDSARAGMLTFEHQAGYQCHDGSRPEFDIQSS